MTNNDPTATEETQAVESASEETQAVESASEETQAVESASEETQAVESASEETQHDKNQPSNLRNIVRSVLALVAGFVTMFVCVSIYQVLFLALPLYLSDPELFKQLMAASSDPQEMKTLMESGTFPLPGTPMLALTLLLDGVSAIVGGFVTAWIASRAKFGHAIVLAVLMTLTSVGYAATSEMEAILPIWVPWGRALLFIPLGGVAGGWLRACCCRPKGGESVQLES